MSYLDTMMLLMKYLRKVAHHRKKVAWILKLFAHLNSMFVDSFSFNFLND